MGLTTRVAPIAKKLPVLIVGGGLGGFTAALSLHRAGIRNNIITKESKFSDHARSAVFLGGSAIRILDRLGLGSEYRGLGMPIRLIEIEDTRGRNVISLRLDGLGTEIWTVPRPSLQQLLLEAIPPDSVHFNTKFRELNVGKSAVRVKAVGNSHLGMELSKAYTCLMEADFVIGADGHKSSVRNFMSRSAMTVSSGEFVWRAVVKIRDLNQFPFHIAKEIWGPEKRFGYVRMNPDEVVWWGVLSNFSDVVLRPFKPRLLREFSSFPDVVTDLISAAEADRVISRVELREVWPEDVPWIDRSSSKIALVGDAGRPGNFGNYHTGHTFAVEDGYFLAHYLAEQNELGLLEKRPELHGYAENREQRMVSMKKYLKRFNLLLNSRSWIRRYFAKMACQLSVSKMVSEGSASIPVTLSKRVSI